MLNRPKRYMRVMMTKNVNVENRFANGTQGYIMYWQPGSVGQSRRSKYAVDVDTPSLMVTFAKQSAVDSGKPRYYEDVDKMDLKPMPEHLPGQYHSYIIEQLPIIPAYGLTTHKSQSLTIRHVVKVCMEGIFAHGSAQRWFLRSISIKDVCIAVCRAMCVSLVCGFPCWLHGMLWRQIKVSLSLLQSPECGSSSRASVGVSWHTHSSCADAKLCIGLPSIDYVVLSYGILGTYVSFSRSTDPKNLVCIGIPPKDLLDDVARSWLSHGRDVHACMEAAVSITGEWEYSHH